MIEISAGRLGGGPAGGSFANLAGVDPAVTDARIRGELQAAGIEVVEHEALLDHPEVHTHCAGKLGGFAFQRNWYYWVVRGRVPLAVAEKLYADPVGKKTVRVAGHCGCPPPEKWTNRYMPDGREVVPTSQKAEIDHFVERLREKGRVAEAAEVLAGIYFSDDPKAGEPFVESYHIDSQEGLNLFVRVLRAEGVA
jgi:hypothetical protein